MHKNTPEDTKPAGRANHPAGHANANGQADPGKTFADLPVRFAAACLSTHSTVQKDALLIYAGRREMRCAVSDLQALAQFAAQIGGAA